MQSPYPWRMCLDTISKQCSLHSSFHVLKSCHVCCLFEEIELKGLKKCYENSIEGKMFMNDTLTSPQMGPVFAAGQRVLPERLMSPPAVCVWIMSEHYDGLLPHNTNNHTVVGWRETITSKLSSSNGSTLYTFLFARPQRAMLLGYDFRDLSPPPY